MSKLINLAPLPKKLVTFKAEIGSPKKVVYKYELDPDYGCPRRVPNGFVDIDDFIQESADDIDFKSLGRALIGQGERDVRHHFFSDEPIVDASQLPHNIHELSAMHNKLKKEFDALPEGLQALFENDYEKFIAAGKNGTVGQTIQDYYTAQQSSAAEPAAAEKDGE